MTVRVDPQRCGNCGSKLDGATLTCVFCGRGLLDDAVRFRLNERPEDVEEHELVATRTHTLTDPGTGDTVSLTSGQALRWYERKKERT